MTGSFARIWRYAPWLIALILVALAAHTGWILLENRGLLRDSKRADAISQAYRQASNAARLAEVQATKFMVTNDSADLEDFEASLREALSTIAFISRNGEAEDRQMIGSLLSTYASEISLAQAIGSGTDEANFTVGDNNTLTEITALLETHAARTKTIAEDTLERFNTSLDRQVYLALFVFGIGFPAALGLVAMMRRYDRNQIEALSDIQKLQDAAFKDSLTGLGNHRAFLEALSEATRAAVDQQVPCVLSVIDFDDFKVINDRDGHARGDYLLIEFARLLRHSEQPDSVSFRVGGDEFSIISRGISLREAEIRMQRFRELIQREMNDLTISSGVASFDPMADDVESLRDKADSALYDAKRRGRNLVASYVEHEGRSLLSSAKLNFLQTVLAEEAVDIHFQPIWDSDLRRRPIAFEALCRFPSFSKSDSVQEVFDLAERMGHSYELDMTALARTIEQAQRLPGDALLFVNIAPQTFEHAQFSALALRDRFGKAGIRPEKVCIELTERSTAPVEALQRVTRMLRGAGFNIVLDDVGSGNSGLEILSQLDVDYVKIDSSVIRGALKSSRSRAVMHAIIAYAVEARSVVIAEGVESEQMLELIQVTNQTHAELKVDLLQGFLLGRPAPVDTLLGLYGMERKAS